MKERKEREEGGLRGVRKGLDVKGGKSRKEKGKKGKEEKVKR